MAGVTYRLAADVLRAPLADDEVLLNTKTGQYHLLNHTGREVLGAIETSGSPDGVSERLASETGAAPDRVAADVTSFVDALLARGLIEAV